MGRNAEETIEGYRGGNGQEDTFRVTVQGRQWIDIKESTQTQSQEKKAAFKECRHPEELHFAHFGGFQVE